QVSTPASSGRKGGSTHASKGSRPSLRRGRGEQPGGDECTAKIFFGRFRACRWEERAERSTLLLLFGRGELLDLLDEVGHRGRGHPLPSETYCSRRPRSTLLYTDPQR